MPVVREAVQERDNMCIEFFLGRGMRVREKER